MFVNLKKIDFFRDSNFNDHIIGFYIYFILFKKIFLRTIFVGLIIFFFEGQLQFS